MPFAVTVDTPLPPAAAWERVTDWTAHGRYVPFTTVVAAADGRSFVARTAVGRFGFDDPMAVVAWDPPRSCRIEKQGRVVLGWAELTVTPNGDGGSAVTWREEAVPARLPRFARGLAVGAGRLVFGRVLRKLLS